MRMFADARIAAAVRRGARHSVRLYDARDIRFNPLSPEAAPQS
jgi:hypothetical protein